MKHNTKKFVLQELADYRESCAENVRIRERINNLKCSGNADVTNRELKILFLRQAYLERVIVAIDNLRENLNEDLSQLFNAKFLTRPSMQDKKIIAQLNVSRAKFYKDIDLICQMLADRLGLS
ncbi:hypothetical protein [Phascolarctobacterium faecium]|jgi:hypothetical protein|uniref:hypothetical protein n=1 Tax=Phascolarctobacterium faecium TaxID=33025 RepID=UPI0039935C39